MWTDKPDTPMGTHRWYWKRCPLERTFSPVKVIRQAETGRLLMSFHGVQGVFDVLKDSCKGARWYPADLPPPDEGDEQDQAT